MRQKNQVELNLGTGAEGEARSAAAHEPEARTAKASLERPAVAGPSMEAVVERENLKEALAQVKRNKGAAGTDGMSVDALSAYLKEHWPAIRAQLLDGTYQPQPVRRVEIPKASGGVRLLGIPTVLDRLIQQAVMQVLQADWDPTFSETSFGFRPKHSAHQAVERAQAYIASGYAVVVDTDLEKFFDRVNHDILMGLIAKRVADKRILKLIRGFLTAGAMEGITVTPISRPFVKGAEHFFGSASCQIHLAIFVSNCRVRTAPVSSIDGCVRVADRARHPSGSSSGPTEACALAAWPPQKNVGTAPHPKEIHRTVAAGVPAPISGWLTVQAIRCRNRW